MVDPDSPKMYYIKSLEVWVGIGGEYKTRAKPPLVTRTIPEATKKQYVEISKTSQLVKVLDKKQKDDTRAK